MRVRLVSALALFFFLVPIATAGTSQFDDGYLGGGIVASGQFAGMSLWAETPHYARNGFQMDAEVITVYTQQTDEYYAVEDAVGFNGLPTWEYDEQTFHNVSVTAVGSGEEMNFKAVPLGNATIQYTTNELDASPSKWESVTGFQSAPSTGERDSYVGDTLQVETEGEFEVRLEGDLSTHIWQFAIQIESDEGTFIYETGQDRQTDLGVASKGPYTSLTMDATNASMTLQGTFNDYFHGQRNDESNMVWIRDAVAEADYMDFQLTDVLNPEDTGTYTNRSRMTVLAVTDESVVADIQEVIPEPVPQPPGHELSPDPTDAGNATNPLLGTDGDGSPVPLTTVASGGPSLPGWLIAAIVTATVAAVFFVVRQTHGWPTHAFFVRRAEEFHDVEEYRRVAILSTLGHLLQPQEARHRFHRGLARQERRDHEGALADLQWATWRLANPEEQAVSAYFAAYEAARTGRLGVAGDMLARAARVDDRFLWDAQQDSVLRPLAGKPEFEASLARGMQSTH